MSQRAAEGVIVREVLQALQKPLFPRLAPAIERSFSRAGLPLRGSGFTVTLKVAACHFSLKNASPGQHSAQAR